MVDFSCKMTCNLVKLELCREPESGAFCAAFVDGFFSISSNRKAFVMKPAFGIALHKQCQLVDLRGLFRV